VHYLTLKDKMEKTPMEIYLVRVLLVVGIRMLVPQAREGAALSVAVAVVDDFHTGAMYHLPA
jgi:hypothetical protein